MKDTDSYPVLNMSLLAEEKLTTVEVFYLEAWRRTFHRVRIEEEVEEASLEAI